MFSTDSLISADSCASSSIASVLEVELDLLGRQQRLVLLHQARLGLGQDAAEVVLVERREADPDRQAALQLGQHVRTAWRDGTRPSR
jgi:hypothetical protein